MNSYASSMRALFGRLVAGPKGAPPAIPPIVINPAIHPGILPWGRQAPNPTIDPRVTPAGPPVAPPPRPSISLQHEGPGSIGGPLRASLHAASRSG